MGKLLDLTGKVFGRLTAISYARVDKKITWKCICSCGNYTSTLSSSLVQGKTKSCGCYKKEVTSVRFTTHGMSKSIEYKHYANMLSRCTNKNHPDYEHYTGRGITICVEFLDSFDNFYKEIGPKPEGKWSVGRIDNTAGYNIGNVRWEDDFEQARNHSMQSNNTSGLTGINIRHTEKDGSRVVARYASINGKRVSKSFSLLKYDLEDALLLAISWRKCNLDSLAEQGILYGEFHGLQDKLINEEEKK